MQHPCPNNQVLILTSVADGQALLEAGAQVDNTDAFGETPLQEAVWM